MGLPIYERKKKGSTNKFQRSFYQSVEEEEFQRIVSALVIWYEIKKERLRWTKLAWWLSEMQQSEKLNF